MSTSDFLPARDDQKFAPGAWSKTYTLSGVSAVSASNWHAYIVRNKGDVQATASLIAPTVSVSVSANTVTFSLTATQVATLIGSGASKFAGYWSVYSDTLARTVVAGHFVIDRTATNSGTSSSPTTLTVTSTTSTLSVVVPTVTSTVLDTWNAARDAAATTVADIVCLTDSIGVLGSVTAKPWPHLLAKSLSAFDSRAEGAGWVFANGNGAAVIAMDSCAGTASTTGAGGYASDMTAGQVAYHTMTCDGVSIVYTKQSGGGSIEVRDGGSGGTLITTISTSAATTARSQVTTVDLTTYASRQVHLTVTGGPVHLEGIYGHAGDQTTGTRVWTPGHSGYTTGDFVTNTTLAMNLIATLDPALVIIATGFNDTNATTYEADLRSLVALVEAQTGNNVAIMSPWGGSDGVASDQAFALAAQTVAGDNDLAYFPLYEMLGAVGANIDPWDLSADGAHPRVGASQMIADLVLSKVAVDPDLVAISTPERGPRDYIGTLVNRQGTSGQLSVENVLGYPVISLYGAEGDTQSQFVAFNGTLAAALGASGAGFNLGAGGSTAADTSVTRDGVSVLKVSSALKVAGLTGATQTARWVGATASGAPASGTFAIGDFIIDRTGKVYICTTAGSPGTWTQAGNSGTVTSVSGTAPIHVATGTTTPAITVDAATTSASGVVELATTAETRTGTDTDRAITPVAAAQTYPTGLIARNSYNPSSLTTYSTTTSLADVDATNMAVTFTAPPSGTVEVELDAMTSGGSVRHTWGLREGTADLVWQGISNDASVGRKVAKFVVSGMTPGSTHTFKWSQLGASTAAATYAGLTSSHYWPAHMRVYGVPVPTSDFDRVLTPLAGSISSQAYSLHVPIGPGPRGLVIWCHGRGGAATDYTGLIRAATATALLDAGYMVGGTAAHGDNFGNDNSLADIKAFYDWVNAAYPVSDVIMWGESMGALDALLISAGVKSVPNVRGAMIFSGVCSLANAYAGIGDAAFTGQINTAYGITGTPPNTYALLTAGYDPVLRSTSDYSGKRFRFTGSSSDTTATKASHMDVMTAAISGVTAECVSVTSTGGHSDASQYADTSAILAYVARCVADS